MKTQRKSDLTVRRDGAVRYWSVYQQSWETVPAWAVSDAELAAMGSRDRERVTRAAERHPRPDER